MTIQIPLTLYSAMAIAAVAGRRSNGGCESAPPVSTATAPWPMCLCIIDGKAAAQAKAKLYFSMRWGGGLYRRIVEDEKRERENERFAKI